MSNSINPTKINDNSTHNLEDSTEPEINTEETTQGSTPIVLIESTKPTIAFWSENPNILLGLYNTSANKRKKVCHG